MPLSTQAQEAHDRAQQYNHNQHDETTNPHGFGGLGYKTPAAEGLEGNWAQCGRDNAILTKEAADQADAAVGAADTVSQLQAATQEDRDEAEGFRDETQILMQQVLALAAAISTNMPAATIGGTGAAYTASFSTSVVIADTLVFAGSIPVSNTVASPTMTIDSTVYTLVLGNARRPFLTGLLGAGRPLLFQVDAANTEIKVYGGVELFEFVRDILANGHRLIQASLIQTQEEVYDLGNVSGVLTLDYAKGHVQHGIVTGDITAIAFANWPVTEKGAWMEVELTQDGTGGHRLMLAHDGGGSLVTVGGGDLLLTQAASAIDELYFKSRDGGTTVKVSANLNWSSP